MTDERVNNRQLSNQHDITSSTSCHTDSFTSSNSQSTGKISTKTGQSTIISTSEFGYICLQESCSTFSLCYYCWKIGSRLWMCFVTSSISWRMYQSAIPFHVFLEIFDTNTRLFILSYLICSPLILTISTAHYSCTFEEWNRAKSFCMKESKVAKMLARFKSYTGFLLSQYCHQ